MALRILVLMIGIAQADHSSAQQPAGIPTVEFTVEVLGDKLAEFTAMMDAYAKLRRSLEAGLPSLKVTDDPHEIQRAERLLAERIRKARAGAGRGDIFTADIRRGFRQLLRPVTNRATCELIRDDNPGEFQYPINSEYPKDRPLSTVPAAMLGVLPRLPDDVFYRFLGRDLILHDSRANVILDRIDDAVRCG
jgi:hypothetical protein